MAAQLSPPLVTRVSCDSSPCSKSGFSVQTTWRPNCHFLWLPVYRVIPSPCSKSGFSVQTTWRPSCHLLWLPVYRVIPSPCSKSGFSVQTTWRPSCHLLWLPVYRVIPFPYAASLALVYRQHGGPTATSSGYLCIV